MQRILGVLRFIIFAIMTSSATAGGHGALIQSPNLPTQITEIASEPGYNYELGDGSWRELHGDHYWSGECCFCAHVEASRPAEGHPGFGEYLVGSVWHRIPNYAWKPHDPSRPTDGTIICDPIKRIYMCVLSDDSG